MSAAGIELTAPQCAGLNGKLQAAVDSKDTKAMRDILDTLKASDAAGKLSILSSTKLSKTVHKLSQAKADHDSTIVALASSLVQTWKGLVQKKTKAADGGPAAARAPSPSPPEATVPKAEPKAEPKPEPAEATNEAARSTPAATASSSSSGRKGSGQVVSTGDPTRDSVVQKLHDVFKKGVAKNEALLRDFDSDSAVMAQECEAGMYEKFGCVTKEYKARFRTLMFNLQDTKNPDFIQAVVTGQRHVSDLAGMDVKEMASESMKKQQLKYSENAKMALMDTKSYEKYAGKEINDGILKCPKCKSMKTEYTEVQTRSADEPTTKKCFCNTCNYRWKFC